MVLIVAIPVWVRQKRAARTREMAAAIQSSALFTKPVTVVASTKTSLSTEPPNFEALTLRDAGLLTIEYEYEPLPSTPKPEPPLIRTMRRTYLARLRDSSVPGLIPKDIAASRDWESFEDPEHQRSGWIVPVGNRRLLELTSIVEGSDTAEVQFNWNWKPNDVGLHFDNNEQTRKPGPRWKRKSNPALSSDFPFKGAAELTRTANGWEVKAIKWDFTMPDRVY